VAVSLTAIDGSTPFLHSYTDCSIIEHLTFVLACGQSMHASPVQTHTIAPVLPNRLHRFGIFMTTVKV